jgi:formiminotetrahydrofolate cyclodeaminase
MASLPDYLSLLASKRPTPGGGSAAAVSAALGAALVGKFARISAENPKYASYRVQCEELMTSADKLLKQLEDARSRDESAYDAVVSAIGMGRANATESAARERELEKSLKLAAKEPLGAAVLAVEVQRLTERALEIPNRNMISDVGCAAEFAHAAVLACAHNVRINHRLMHDKGAIASQENGLQRSEHDSHTLVETVRRHVTSALAAKT